MRKESPGSRSESSRSGSSWRIGYRSQVQRLIQESAGGGGDGVSGKAEVGAQIRLGLRCRLSERIRQSPEAYASSGTIQLRRPRVFAIPRSSSRAGCCRH